MHMHISSETPWSFFRLLFPEHSEEQRKVLANELLEQSGIRPSMRAQELTVEDFGTVCKNYQHNFMNNSVPHTPKTNSSSPIQELEVG